MLKLKTSFRPIAAGVLVLLAASAVHAQYQVANSTNGSQVSGAPIKQALTTLNGQVATAQATANGAQASANSAWNYADAAYTSAVNAYNTGVNAYNTAVFAYQTGANAQASANDAWNYANVAYQTGANAQAAAANAQASANYGVSLGQYGWSYSRFTYITYCQMFNGGPSAYGYCSSLADAYYPQH